MGLRGGRVRAEPPVQLVALYLLVYLYDGVRLSTSGIATLTAILTAARVWDAVNDLIIGLLVDRTRTRWGTFRPYILLTALPIAALTVLLFSAPTGSETQTLAVIGIAYLLWDAVYTLSDVPYWSLTTVITTDDASRAALVSRARTAGMLAVATVTLAGDPLAVALSGGAEKPTTTGWSRAALVVSALGMSLFTLAFFTTREKVAHRPEPLPIRETVRQFRSNPPLFLALASGVLSFGQTLVVVGGAVVASVVFGDVRLFSVLGGALIADTVVGALSAPAVLRRHTRRRTLMGAGLGTGVAYASLLLISHRSLVPVAAVMAVIGLFVGVYAVTQTLVVGDTADYAEARTGHRLDGACFAGLTFITKLNSALATLVFGSAVAWVGYQADLPVTDAMRDGLWRVLGIVPALSCVLGLLPLRWYAVPERDLPALLAARRSGDAPTPDAAVG